MRGFLQRILLGIAGTVVLGAVLACPPSKPPVVNPPDADAAPAPPPLNCAAATGHRAQLGCADQQGFPALCLSVNDQRFADCVAAAPSCPAMDGCDPALLAGAKRARK